MAAWPEITNVIKENRYELLLCGDSVSERLQKKGLSEELFSCKSLNFLQITDTCLSEIPSQIKLLYNLTSLILHSNKLTKLCTEIEELTKLKVLNVSNNQLTEIPAGISKLASLTTLNVSSNTIEKMPDLSNNKLLTAVDFSFNLLTDMSELCNGELMHLVEVNLKGNKIESVPSAVKVLSSLKVFDISNNEVTQVAGELGDIPKLKDISLQGNSFIDKKLGKIVTQGKCKQILGYIREHCPRENCDNGPTKGKKSKTKTRTKSTHDDQENAEPASACKYKIKVLKNNDGCCIKKTKSMQEIRPHILACVIRNVMLDDDSLKKFIQLQTKMHEGICDKRNIATIATHDLLLCKGKVFTYTALPPDELKIIPLSRNKEFTGKELFHQLQTEAENLRKEKKRNTYFGIHKFLHLIEGKPLYPCVLNSEQNVISFPPLTNSDTTKISTQTKDIFVEVTSSGTQGHCKRVLDALLKEMVQSGICTENNEDCAVLNVEVVRVEETDGKLIAVYPSRVDLEFQDNFIQVVRD